MRKPLFNSKVTYQVILLVLLIISVYILIRLAPVLTRPEYLPSDDFLRYWSSGKLNLLGENPYDPLRIEQLQIELGALPSSMNASSIMLNPPWAISIIMPFALLSYPVSRLVWLIISTVLLVISSQLLWKIYSSQPKQRWVALLVVFIFAPAISVLEKGQITTLLLLGIVGFLYYSTCNRNDWLAGIFLAIVSIKPQLIFLFWIVVIFWLFQKRRWLIPISAAITIVCLTTIALIINPHIIQQYIIMVQTYQVSDWANPTIGSYLRFFWLGTEVFWPQFLPALIGIIWLVYYWYKRRGYWDWMSELPIILLVSQVTSPYSWTYDLVILVPAILPAVVWIISEWKRLLTILVSILFLGINILDMLLHRSLDDFWFVWLAPTLFIWFLLVRWQYPRLQKGQETSALYAKQ